MGLLMSFMEQWYAKVDKISALHSGVVQQYYGMKILLDFSYNMIV